MYKLSQVERGTLNDARQKPESEPTLLRALGIRKCFGRNVVLDGVDVELHKGEVVLLVGENGSGKTTLLNILTGNLEPDAGTIQYLADNTPRAYEFPRPWWRDLNPWDHFRPEFVALEGIGRTWQDVRLFATQSVLDNIAVASTVQPGENPLAVLINTRGTRRSEREVRARAAAILGHLGLGNRSTSLAGRLSYGQSKRVAIARAVAADARVLFLDEPLAGLDQRGIDETLTLLHSLVLNNDLTLVIVEHLLNQPHLRPLVTTSWTLNGGKLIVSETAEKSRPILPSGIPRPTWLQLLVAGSEVVDEVLPRGAVLTRIRPRREQGTPTKPNLELRNLVVNRGNRTVIGMEDDGSVTGLTLLLYPGEIGILQAPNGWGKTTLLNAVAGLCPIASGSIHLLGQNLKNAETWERVRAGLRVAFGATYLFDNLTVKETLELVGASGRADGQAPLLSQRVSELSGGQRQCLALESSTRLAGAQVLLFDEPFSMLDATNTEKALTLMRPSPESSVLISVPLTTNQDA